MNERQTPDRENGGEDGTDKIVTLRGPLHPHEQHDADTTTTEANEPQQPGQGPIKRYLGGIKRAGVDRHIELLLTFVVALFAGTQWYTVWKNNDSTTQQTDQLIAAAKISAHAADQNLIAARSFATSANGINEGVSGAVDKLTLQARAIEAARQSSVEQSRKALDVTIADSQRDQRAWVGVESFSIEQFEPNKPVKVSIIITNRGKTPALDVKTGLIGGTLVLNTASTKEVVEGIGKINKSFEMIPSAVITPGGQTSYNTFQQKPLEQWEFDLVKSQTRSLLILGRIEFNDVSKHPQWVEFCLRIHYRDGQPTISYAVAGNNLSYQ